MVDGGFDTYSRLIGRHRGKHIPGNPTVVVENMTGAASLLAANHVYMESLKDPKFIADAKKSRLDTDPLTGEEIEKIVAQLFKMDAGLVNQLKEILK